MSVTKAQWAAVREATVRLSYANCDGHDKHDDECPFCRDVAAYQGLIKAFPSVAATIPPDPSGPSVSMWDIRRGESSGQGA